MSKVYFKYFARTIPFSIVIFLAILYPLVSLKNSIDITENEKLINTKIVILSDKEIARQAFNMVGTQCSSIGVNCNELIEKKIQEIKLELKNKNQVILDSKKEVGFIEYIFDTNFMILFIYIMLILALNFQFSILVCIWCQKKKEISKVFYDVSDWAINTPPIIGVLGTIVSFSILVAQSGDIQQSFSKSFFDAALTTIAGGLIYSINLFLKIFIFKHVSSK